MVISPGERVKKRERYEENKRKGICTYGACEEKASGNECAFHREHNKKIQKNNRRNRKKQLKLKIVDKIIIVSGIKVTKNVIRISIPSSELTDQERRSIPQYMYLELDLSKIVSRNKGDSIRVNRHV